jgi:quercetin dioxygenase-like cupin family protein
MKQEQYKKLVELLKDVKPIRVDGKKIPWKEFWGKSGVFGKYLVSKADGFPFSVTLKKFPKTEEIVKEGGYVVHAHPTLEIGIVVKGKFKVYFEDVGVIEADAGCLIVQPPGLKHAAVSSEEDTEVVAINIPPADWEESAKS